MNTQNKGDYRKPLPAVIEPLAECFPKTHHPEPHYNTGEGFLSSPAFASVEKWAAEKAAFERGETIQFSTEPLCWRDCGKAGELDEPKWAPHCEYRIKPWSKCEKPEGGWMPINESERRAEWLSSRGADQSWIIVTFDEVAAAKADFVKLETERNELRAKLAMCRDVLKALYSDSTASDFNEHWDSYKNAQQALDQTK